MNSGMDSPRITAILVKGLIRRFILELYKIVKNAIIIKKQIFLGYLIFIFIFILVANLGGMTPYNVTISSYFIISFFFALIIFIVITITGIRYHGFDFIKIFLPEGVPMLIALLLVGIELFSYISRVLSLSIRLFANMLSGHTLLKILVTFLWIIMSACYCSNRFYIASLLSLIIIAVAFLEALIAFLQAYIFLVLCSIYFNDVIHIH
jgi:ATP synthase subunit 6